MWQPTVYSIRMSWGIDIDRDDWGNRCGRIWKALHRHSSYSTQFCYIYNTPSFGFYSTACEQQVHISVHNMVTLYRETKCISCAWYNLRYWYPTLRQHGSFMTSSRIMKTLSSNILHTWSKVILVWYTSDVVCVVSFCEQLLLMNFTSNRLLELEWGMYFWISYKGLVEKSVGFASCLQCHSLLRIETFICFSSSYMGYLLCLVGSAWLPNYFWLCSIDLDRYAYRAHTCTCLTRLHWH